MKKTHLITSIVGVAAILSLALADGWTQIRVNSNKGHRAFYSIRNRGARLHQQFSSAPCIKGSTWGRNRDGIWVSGGCRASFDVRLH
jgi:hypothetical protein